MTEDVSALARRIKDACLRTKLSESEISRRMGVARGLVGHWINGRSVPTPNHLSEFIRVTRVNGHWLLTGEGTPDLLIFAPVGVVSAEDTPLPSSDVRPALVARKP